MATRPKTVPTYRRRADSNQAIVTLTDAATTRRRDYWLGEFGSPASRERYHRVIADWESRGRRLPPPIDRGEAEDAATTFNEMALEYWRFVISNYDATAVGHLRGLIRIARRYFGSQPAVRFGPNALRLVREAMINGDPHADPPRKPWSRPYINSQIHRLCRMFKWAASHEMIPVRVYHQLVTVPALRKGRSPAREPDPVNPVPIENVDAVRPHLSRQVEALIDLQLLTGARGSELFRLRPLDIEIDEKRGVWTVRLEVHKTSHHGHRRTIYLGPRTQNVVRPFMTDRALDAFLFSPAEAEAERRAALTALRTTPLSCGNTFGSNRVARPARQPGPHYTAESYRRAIANACDRAFPHPDAVFHPCIRSRPSTGDSGAQKRRGESLKEVLQRLTPEQRRELDRWKKDHRWHPHQLRHTAATIIRRECGLEAARIALGHLSALITDAIYAERDMEKVIDVMKKIG